MALNAIALSLGPDEICAEVTMSRRLAALASDATAEGFPFVAEHLKHLALFVLDEASYARRIQPAVGDVDDIP